jgi:hypothetical protein
MPSTHRLAWGAGIEFSATGAPRDCSAVLSATGLTHTTWKVNEPSQNRCSRIKAMRIRGLPMWPLVGIPPSILQGLTAYRSIFFREAGFVHVSRYVTGLLLSPYKTLQGIYSQWVFPEGESVSRRAMHEAVFEARWDREGVDGSASSSGGPAVSGSRAAGDWTGLDLVPPKFVSSKMKG